MLSKAERHLLAQAAANEKWSKTDPHEGTRAAREAGVTTLDYWKRKVDPECELPEPERDRRAECARKAHYARMAAASAKARRERRATRTRERGGDAA